MRLLRNVVLAAGAAALVVCAGTQANAEEDPLVIGIAKSSTGFMSAYDMPAKLGIEFAIDDINAEGGLLGRKLTSIWRDTKTDKAQAVIAAQELIDEGADILSVSCDFDYGGPSASVAQENGMIALGCAGSPAGLRARATVISGASSASSSDRSRAIPVRRRRAVTSRSPHSAASSGIRLRPPT